RVARVVLRLVFFSYSCSVDLRSLHSFPTRRSSDLFDSAAFRGIAARYGRAPAGPSNRWGARAGLPSGSRSSCRRKTPDTMSAIRSEEHTSELQSLRHLVCRLLLEKKKCATSQQQHP